MIEPRKLFQFRKEQAAPIEAVPATPVCFSLEVPVDLPYFEGHFPNNPVLPAVAMVDASLEALRNIMGVEATPFIKKIRSAKFTDLVGPGNSMRLEVTAGEGGRWTIVWKKKIGQTEKQTAEIILEL